MKYKKIMKNKKIPVEYWLFNDLFYRDQYKEYKYMSYREQESNSSSNGKFKSGLGTHIKNIRPNPTRGGYRL